MSWCEHVIDPPFYAPLLAGRIDEMNLNETEPKAEISVRYDYKFHESMRWGRPWPLFHLK